MSDNRRVRMTKKLMKDAYLELLERSPSEKISEILRAPALKYGRRERAQPLLCVA